MSASIPPTPYVQATSEARTDATSLPVPAGLDPAAGAARVRIRLWDGPTRLFHWSLVLAVSTAVITGQIGGDWMRIHGWAGLSIIGLVVFRLVWGFVGSTHSRFASFVAAPRRVVAYLRGRWQGVGHNPLGALSVLALLGLLAAQALTGLFSNDDIAFTGPLAARVSDELSARLTGWHHQLANVLLALIGLHLLAVLFYVLIRKDQIIRPMLTGDKEVSATEPVQPTRQAGWVSFAIALVLALGAVYLASGAVDRPASPAAAAPAEAPAPKAVAPAW